MYGTYNPTYEVADCLRNVSKGCKEYLSECGFTSEVEDILSNNKGKQLPIMDGCISERIVQSQNLVNAAHFDINDNSMSISIFTEEKIGEALGWYFILPNVSIDGKRGILIELSQGVTIAWDGRKVWHCSAVKEVGEGNNVFGTFFGS